MTLSPSHILRLLSGAAAFMVCAAALVSCGEEFREPEPEKTIYKAAFYITVGSDTPTLSRATPTDGEYRPGEGFENYVDMSEGSIRIAVLDFSNNLMGEITDFSITPLESNLGSKRYLINASTEANLSGGNFKIMVLANWGKDNYPKDLFIDDVWATKFSYKPGRLGYDNLIPLYGIKEVSVGHVEEGVAVHLGTIHLLRALAKIEVTYTDPSGICDIATPQITLHHNSGYCAPRADSEDDYVKNSWELDYTGFARIPDDAVVQGPIEMLPEGTNRWVIYLPEFDHNVNTHDNAQIAVDFNDNILGRQLIDFHDSNNRVISIMRNYWYRVNIKKGISKPEVTVDVLPYAVVDLEPDYGIVTSSSTRNSQ